MNKTKNVTSNEAKKWNFSSLKKLDLIFVFLIILSTWFFGQILLKNKTLVSFFKNFESTPDILSICPIVSSSLMIAAWFLYRGKSVKSLNDIILFFSASYALYLFLLDNNEYKRLNDIEAVVNDTSLFFSKIGILTCTLAKTFITLFEFVIDWTKENSERKNLLKQEQHYKDDKSPEESEEEIKNERFELNYKYKKSEGNKFEHEEFSIMKFEKKLKKDIESGSSNNSEVNQEPVETTVGTVEPLSKNSSKNTFLLILILFSLILLSTPFIYTIFIRFYH